MKNRYQILLFVVFLLQLNRSLSSFYPSDAIQKDKTLNPSISIPRIDTHPYSRQSFMLALENNLFAVAYIGEDFNPYITFIKNGNNVFSQHFEVDNQSEKTIDINLIQFSNDSVLVSFSRINSSDNPSCYGKIVSITNGSIGSRIDYLSGEKCNYVKGVQIGEKKSLLTASILDSNEDWITVSFGYDELSGSPNISNSVNLQDSNSISSMFSDIEVLNTSPKKIIAIFQENGKNADTDKDTKELPLYIQELDISGQKNSNINKLVPGTHGAGKRHLRPILRKFDDGYCAAWSEEIEGKIWFSCYTNDHNEKCQNILEDTPLSDFQIYKDIAYVTGKSSNGQIYGIEIQIDNCAVIQEKQVIFSNSSYKQVSMSISKNPIETSVMTFSVISQDAIGGLHFKFLEYFLDQIQDCTGANSDCYGCYGSYTCPICKGSSPRNRDLRRSADGKCLCQKDGYFYQAGDLDCSRCQNQCKRCENGEECLECKNEEMFMPMCIYYKKDKFTITKPDGSVQYKECAPKCLSCEGAADNCKQCGDGQNRLDDTNLKCACLKGYYDMDGTLKNCLKCSDMCQECSNFSVCTSCDSSKNLILNAISGECKCKMGYIQDLNFNCIKAYQLSDKYVIECPQNTYQDEELQICQYYDYQILSHKILIILAGTMLSYQGFVDVYNKGQFELIQKREIIYSGMNKNQESQEDEEEDQFDEEQSDQVSPLDEISYNKSKSNIYQRNLDESEASSNASPLKKERKSKSNRFFKWLAENIRQRNKYQRNVGESSTKRERKSRQSNFFNWIHSQTSIQSDQNLLESQQPRNPYQSNLVALESPLKRERKSRGMSILRAFKFQSPTKVQAAPENFRKTIISVSPLIYGTGNEVNEAKDRQLKEKRLQSQQSQLRSQFSLALDSSLSNNQNNESSFQKSNNSKMYYQSSRSISPQKSPLKKKRTGSDFDFISPYKSQKSSTKKRKQSDLESPSPIRTISKEFSYGDNGFSVKKAAQKQKKRGKKKSYAFSFLKP